MELKIVYLLFILTAAYPDVVNSTLHPYICPNRPLVHCLGLVTETFIHPKNLLDAAIAGGITALFGKRSDVAYMRCVSTCLPYSNSKKSYFGVPYYEVYTKDDQSHQTMLTPVAWSHKEWHSDNAVFSSYTQLTTTVLPPTTVLHSNRTTPICDKISLMTSLLHQNHVENKNVGSCPDGTHSQSESVLMNFCNSNEIRTWSQGKQVTKYCGSIPMYSPVAAFVGHQYHHYSNYSAGVFLGCSGNGFQIASQKCGGFLKIVNIDATSSIDPAFYFTLLW